MFSVPRLVCNCGSVFSGRDYSDLFFGHFSGNSTQLELAVFEFFGDLSLSFFKILLEF